MNEKLSNKRKERRMYNFIYRFLGPMLRFVYRLEFIGQENVPAGAAIVCTNHSSAIDPLLLSLAVGFDNWLHYMAKAELFDIPILGKIIEKAGTFPVKRGESDVNAIRTAIRYLKNGEKIMIFPEGTRVSSDDAVAAKTGAVRLAAQMNVPIVPANIPRKKRPFRRNRVVIGVPYYLDKSVKNADSERYRACSAELMDKIKELGKD